ncbi:MAG: DUF1592 domain-containing protein [Planctomycetota bacterium]
MSLFSIHSEYAGCFAVSAKRADAAIRSLIYSFLVSWTACLIPVFCVCSDATSFAQEVAEDENVEIEWVDEDDEEEDGEPTDEMFEGEVEDLSERSQELGEIRGDLVEQIRESRNARAERQACIRSIDTLLELDRQRRSLVKKLNSVKDQRDQATVERYRKRLEKNIRVSEARHRLFGFQIHEIEFSEQIEESIAGEDGQMKRLAQVLRKGLNEGKSLANEWVQIILREDEHDAFEIEEELEILFDERVHAPAAAMELIVGIREAEMEEDPELSEELREEFRELQEEFDLTPILDEDPTLSSEGRLQKEDRARRANWTLDPAMQPVLVNAETLAPFAESDIDRDVTPLLKKFCFDCHSNESSSGELNFEQLLRTTPIVKNRRKWINVIEQTKNHVMPPEDWQQPTIEERKKIVLSLHHAIFNFDYSQIDDPGYESARRLTHREYSNTVRDLFGIDVDVTDRFPVDLTATSGFDNSANSLFIQPLLMERYVGLAEYVVDRALPEWPKTEAEKRARERLIIAHPSETEGVASAAKRVVTRFLWRAFRRQPTNDEVKRYAETIERSVRAGETFDHGVKAALRTALVSPNFLLRMERAESNNGDSITVDDFDLASRLSYFLWASMPDDLLLQLAHRGELSNPDVLKQQVERMLGDPKSESLGSVFASQWLGSQYLGTRVRLDPIDNPWCTDTLMAAMRQETSMFFHHLVRHNRPIIELVNADYTFVNEELARLYRIPDVTGEQMRRVDVDPTRRGGILGHGSLLAVTSFPGRTSPVVRGNWILDTVLGTPPPPPPPNVSELSEDLESKRRLSFREKLELHRDKPNCYACHSQMDPLGFSLENFDWFGRYRTRRGRVRIDATGRLPDGTEFSGLSGLKQVIREQRKSDFIRQLSQKLLSYALGRQLEYYDEPAVRRIIHNIDQSESRMGDLVREIVLSYPFRFKRSRSTQPVPTNSSSAESRVSLR